MPEYEFGKVHVWEAAPATGNWVQRAVLVGDDLTVSDQFGCSVALDGNRIAAGARVHDLPDLHGAAYVFELVDSTWEQSAKLVPAEGTWIGEFGSSIDVQGPRIAVGARGDKSFAHTAGAVHLFEEGPGGWTEVAKLQGSGYSTGDALGNSVDLEGEFLVAGAPHVSSGADAGGEAYVFSLDQITPSLLGGPTSVSLSQGGEQTLHLGACTAHAGDLFALAGSATGTSPGFFAGGLPVPLNPDVYFLHTIHHLGAPPLVGGLGVLDEFGYAQATFTLAPGTQPSLAGLVLHHAYAVLDGATWQFEAVSGAAPVTLVP